MDVFRPILPYRQGYTEKEKDGVHYYEPTPEQLKKEQTEHDNKMLKAKLKASSETQQFLEDCLAEMAQVVYA